MIVVHDVEVTSAWYQAVLDLRSGHGGSEYEMLMSGEQLVLQLHYVEGLTYKEISGMLDVSEPRVCQLHADAITKVRAAMGSAD